MIEQSRGLDPSQWVDQMTTVLGTPATAGNAVRILRNGNEIFAAMLNAIDQSEVSVDLVTFVYWSGDIAKRFADRLAAAAQRGCQVRILLDAFGARRSKDQVLEMMRDAGCEVRWFRPPFDGLKPQLFKMNHRTHRKILVCDRSVGFTGGVGIADEWDGDATNRDEWRDTHIEVRGPAVAGLLAGFLDNWTDRNHDAFDPANEPPASLDEVGSTVCTVVRGSAETGSSELWRLMLTLIVQSRVRVNLMTAYFNPDDVMLAALCDAAARGVKVRVIVPGDHHDKRFVQLAGQDDYIELLDAGITVWTYDVSMMHAKIVTVDGVVATIGSANFNSRSTRHDEETNVVLFDPKVVEILDDHFNTDLDDSTELDAARWRDRGVLQRLGEAVTSLVDRWN